MQITKTNGIGFGAVIVETNSRDTAQAMYYLESSPKESGMGDKLLITLSETDSPDGKTYKFEAILTNIKELVKTTTENKHKPPLEVLAEAAEKANKVVSFGTPSELVAMIKNIKI